MTTSKHFAWINFHEWPGLMNFAWIYVREDRDFEKYFSLKKRKEKRSKAFTILMGFDL